MKKIKIKSSVYSQTPLQNAIGIQQENSAPCRSPVRSCHYQTARRARFALSCRSSAAELIQNPSRLLGTCENRKEHKGVLYFQHITCISIHMDLHTPRVPLSGVNSNSGYRGPRKTKHFFPNKPGEEK